MLKTTLTHFLILFLFTFFVSCTANNRIDSNQNRAIASFSVDQEHLFRDQIQPIFDKRCVVCHACTEAPCQLHLDSYSGLRRGATYTELGANILYTPPTREKDGKSITEWRLKNFFPVIPDPHQEYHDNNTLPPPRDSDVSLLYRFIELGSENNKAGFALEPTIDARKKSHTCAPNLAAFEGLTKEHTWVGMPYGFPGLRSEQLALIKKWIDQGARSPAATVSPTDHVSHQLIAPWEQVMNSTSKAQLMARYIYEHVFSAHIHFKGTSHGEWYELVRSSTPAPHSIEEIVTPRPYDPPPDGIKVYYRFQRIHRTIARASHIPWEIDHKLLEHFKTLFLKMPWQPATPQQHAEFEPITNPGYSSKNPFKYFQQIPAKLRYQFLLENSQLIANAMIRGPACSGRVATSAIRDHFWVFFLKPESDVTVLSPEIGLAEWTPLSELDIRSFVKPHLKYTNAMKKLKPDGFGIADMWTDNKESHNALLTIFRHGTSASVHQGLLGGMPPTFWVLNFSNFERIYYNLVADYELWGSSAHKASTWNYMSRHRSEAEERFISFLPENIRSKIRYQWTQGLGQASNLTQAALSEGIKSKVNLTDSTHPIDSLITQLLAQFSATQINPQNQIQRAQLEVKDLNHDFKNFEDWEQTALSLFEKTALPAVRYFPEIVYLRIDDRPYTIINNRFYKFNNIIAMEKFAYEPNKNKMYLMRNLIGDKPEYFADLSLKEARGFLVDLRMVYLFSDWVKFKNKYFTRRNQPPVWALSDWFTDWQKEHQPLEAGALDLREYDVEIDRQ
ncbi:MAG: hypothetical protein RJB66_1915 [Pseudomonadota bacterium]